MNSVHLPLTVLFAIYQQLVNRCCHTELQERRKDCRKMVLKRHGWIPFPTAPRDNSAECIRVKPTKKNESRKIRHQSTVIKHHTVQNVPPLHDTSARDIFASSTSIRSKMQRHQFEEKQAERWHFAKRYHPRPRQIKVPKIRVSKKSQTREKPFVLRYPMSCRRRLWIMHAWHIFAAWGKPCLNPVPMASAFMVLRKRNRKWAVR